MNFLFFGLTASCLFVIRRRERLAPTQEAAGFRTPWHPLSTGLFILACVAIVGFSFWAQPKESLIGYAILLLGAPPYLYWRRTGAPAPAAL
jgi:APA family basic amino acid/polyamine antiporter